MSITAFCPSTPLDADVLCAAFNATLDPCPKTSKEAESLLSQLSLTPGLLLLVASIITNVSLNSATRSAAALFLENEVRSHWEAEKSSEDSQKLNYSEEEKSAFRDLLISLLESLLSEGVPVDIINSIDDCVRCIGYADFPDNWPTVFPHVVEQLRLRANVNSVKASLLILRHLVKFCEYRCFEERISRSFGLAFEYTDREQGKGFATIREIVRVSFPLLLTLATDRCRDRNCFEDEDSAWIVSIICKTYCSSLYEKIVENSSNDWMRLMEHIIITPVPDSVLAAHPVESERSTLQPYKAKKWALYTVDRFLCRGEINQLNDHFYKNWMCKFTECLIRVLEAERNNGVWITDHMKKIILLHLENCLAQELTYTSIRPHVEFILYEVCFPLLCYTPEDVARWESNPAEFNRPDVGKWETDEMGRIRKQGVVVPRDSAVVFIQTLAQLRESDFLEPITNFAQSILVAHQAASAADQTAVHNQRKYGALFLQLQLQVEPFLIQFVFPELSNLNDPFLRLRACWTYRQFLDAGVEKYEKPQALNDAFLKVVDLCKDPQLPIRVEASTTLKSFFYIKQDEIRAGVVAHIPQLMENLLKLMTEPQCSEQELEVRRLKRKISELEEDKLILKKALYMLSVSEKPAQGYASSTPPSVDPIVTVNIKQKTTFGCCGGVNVRIKY